MKITIHACEWKDESKKIAIIGDLERELPTKNRLEFMQKVVGGLIDIYHYEDNDWVVNDEGLLLGLPINPFAKAKGLNIAGTIIEVHGVLD